VHLPYLARGIRSGLVVCTSVPSIQIVTTAAASAWIQVFVSLVSTTLQQSNKNQVFITLAPFELHKWAVPSTRHCVWPLTLNVQRSGDLLVTCELWSVRDLNPISPAPESDFCATAFSFRLIEKNI